MRIYLECSMGASGDMLMAALYELLPDKDVFKQKMDNLGLKGVTFDFDNVKKCGISGTHITVKVHGVEEKSVDVHNHAHSGKYHGKKHNKRTEHSHHAHSENSYSYNDIIDLLNSLELPENIKEDAVGVYRILGGAEAQVHGVSTDKLHLHEVGSVDAVADIVGCCMLINMLGVTDIAASPVHVGSGFVECEHGTLPVPAPATANILKDVPIYGGAVKGELCTPTGAALLKHFVTRFGEMLPMTLRKIGYGMGAKDFSEANCLRAYLSDDDPYDGGGRDRVYEISCNLDDMTPEAVGAAFDILLDNGALDVYQAPVIMKKNRPGVILTCLCTPEDRGKISRLMLRHTSTLGVRVTECRRDILNRSLSTVTTKYGEIRMKKASGYGVDKHKPEYEDVKAAAERHGVSFTKVYDEALAVSSEQILV